MLVKDKYCLEGKRITDSEKSVRYFNVLDDARVVYTKCRYDVDCIGSNRWDFLHIYDTYTGEVLYYLD